MSKRLRKRIRELCRLETLDRAERRLRAQSILDSTQFKQRLCNRVPGLSFKDIERTMLNILADTQPTKEEIAEKELKRIAPQKFDPDIEIKLLRKTKKITYRELTREEARKLVEASSIPVVSEISHHQAEYSTYTHEEVQALMDCNYDPHEFKCGKKRN